jgi:hypothetical protein
MRDIAEIAEALEGRREGRGWRCTCPVCFHHNLTLNVGARQPIIFKCWNNPENQCGGYAILAALREQGILNDDDSAVDYASSAAPLTYDADAIKYTQRGIEVARDLYCNWSVPAANTIVERYLETRGLSPVPVLRFLYRCPHSRLDGYWPAMLAPITNVDGDIIGIHKTFLRPDGAGKVGLPKNLQRDIRGLSAGGAVKLMVPRLDAPLLIATGIETSLSAAKLFNLPAWATLSDAGLKSLLLSSDIRHIAIAADRDLNGAGQRAALAAYERWTAEGRKVELLLPSTPGFDFNDELRARTT